MTAERDMSSHCRIVKRDCKAVGLMDDVVACVVSDVLVKMPYVDGELPVYWWDSEADRCMVIGIFRHGMYMCVTVCTSVCSLSVTAVDN